MQDSSSTSSSSTNINTGKQELINNNNEQSQTNQEQIQESVLSARGRRNALTPESHDVEPIRQTEILEKMSTLTMAGTSGGASANQQGAAAGGGDS